MKIKTRYGFGDEVWPICFRDGRWAVCLRMVIRAIEIQALESWPCHDELYHGHDFNFEEMVSSELLYPYREAAQAECDKRNKD